MPIDLLPPPVMIGGDDQGQTMDPRREMLRRQIDQIRARNMAEAGLGQSYDPYQEPGGIELVKPIESADLPYYSPRDTGRMVESGDIARAWDRDPFKPPPGYGPAEPGVDMAGQPIEMTMSYPAPRRDPDPAIDMVVPTEVALDGMRKAEAESVDKIDRGTLESFENKGSPELVAYSIRGSKASGPTISTGVDIGQWTEDGMRSAGVPEHILSEFRPFFGVKGYEATEAAFAEHGRPVLSPEDSKILDEAIYGTMRSELEDRFNRDSNLRFSDLPARLQTTMFLTYYNAGPALWNEYSNLWRQYTQADIPGAIENLRNWKSKSKFSVKRRNDEGVYLAGGFPSLAAQAARGVKNAARDTRDFVRGLGK